MTSLHIQTALLAHPQLSVALGKKVWLKMENTQPSGSFKLRGIGLLCQRAVTSGATRLVCPSGGNAGFAAAFAGAALGVRTTVVVPETTSAAVIARIRDIGAEVIVHGSAWHEANQAALTLCEQAGVIYIPPFDHPDIWDGNATLIDEAVAQAKAMGFDFDVVICAVGGGGLMSGILEGMHRNGLKEVPLIAVETDGAASLHAAVAAGELVSLAAVTSIATSLNATRVAAAAFNWTRQHTVLSVKISDAQAVAACLSFANDMRTLVEPACGAALAVAYQRLPELDKFERPLIVVCGGIGVSLETLANWKNHFSL
ncbi:pyridoxal-phosphate dependent enzyme [Glaciimonas sp. CA11.2]|uniref:pyridoxal-phosphate dependent enzyme n=1 Tax=Glaciimonas sp. CA11.2 TaxID=3048601 RepID=UPI002AB4B1C8|nr:pyridoxal-phosphate dependent enzyme [Glaciimonas sp. CA11.2]MDY7545972.1 pyridoxal-phosphate dependent enzyme [Glaciimonas sp. CA11.2]MEB0161325.1 pyridoxal-phosphate dependent enzyme [Glaciimonas sp. CA11.2]